MEGPDLVAANSWAEPPAGECITVPRIPVKQHNEEAQGAFILLVDRPPVVPDRQFVGTPQNRTHGGVDAPIHADPGNTHWGCCTGSARVKRSGAGRPSRCGRPRASAGRRHRHHERPAAGVAERCRALELEPEEPPRESRRGGRRPGNNQYWASRGCGRPHRVVYVCLRLYLKYFHRLVCTRSACWVAPHTHQRGDDKQFHCHLHP